jgi:dTDP-4-amino-4,6-dideoxygalactose transaminase
MKVPFVDLKAQYDTIKVEIDKAINNVITNTEFIGGRPVKEFEEQFAALYGAKHCISTANGTDSLYIVLKMLGIGNGDEVITVANSWISSSETISQTGAKPVFVDINPDYYSIDESKLEAAITERTKCIIPVHLQGQMCEMDVIMNLANKHSIPVLEDCAQSHFSEFKGGRAGLFGLAGSFSFYPGKNLGAYGDAGCIITNDDEFALKCKMYARHGALIKHQHQIEGINSRLDGLQAAILSVKLPHILNWTEKRREVASNYNERLEGVGDLVLPKVRPNSKHSYHLYVIRTGQRDALKSHLAENNIQTAIHYPVALPNMDAYHHLGYQTQDFPIASSFEDQILSLPIYPEISEDQLDFVSNIIIDFFERKFD